MRFLTTILLSILTIISTVAAVFLAIDGNLARLTGWYRFEPGMPLFSEQNSEKLSQVHWMRISSLNEMIECERREDDSWWIVKPYVDRMSPTAVQAILAFTAQAKLVDTLPLNKATKANMRAFGVETSPHSIVLKIPYAKRMTTLARYTLGSEAPWLADAGDGESLIPTTYLRTDHYGRDKRIHVVTGNILSIFKNGLNGLRDPFPIGIAPDSIEAISIENQQDPSSKVELRRASAETDWVITRPLPSQANQEIADRLLHTLHQIKALRVAELSDVHDLPPVETATKITLATFGGKQGMDIFIYPPEFSEQDDMMVSRATSSDRRVVFTLPASARVTRKGCFARIINSVYALPVLPPADMAKLKSGESTAYTADLALQFQDIRSRQFCKLDERDISRVAITSRFSGETLILQLVPGDAATKLEDQWYFRIGQHEAQQAETNIVLRLLKSLRDLPTVDFVEDVALGGNTVALMHKYGLDQPDYILTLMPRPSIYRSDIFGIDAPLVKDRSVRTFLMKRGKDETGKSRWVGAERDTHTVFQLGPKLMRQFSIYPQTWKLRQLFDFTIASVDTITLGFQQAPLVLHYDFIDEEWTGTMNEQDISSYINPHRATHYLRSLQKVNVSQWLDPQDVDALEALKTPHFSIKLDLTINSLGEQEAIIIDQHQNDNLTDAELSHLSEEQRAESYLNNLEGEDDQRMRDLALNQFTYTKKTITVEIAPYSDDEEPSYYGRIKETGELFILSFDTAMGLGASILDMPSDHITQ